MDKSESTVRQSGTGYIFNLHSKDLAFFSVLRMQEMLTLVISHSNHSHGKTYK